RSGGALLFVIFGIMTIYAQYYGFFVIAAEVVFIFVFVRWNRELYLRVFGLFAAIGLSFIPWILPLIRGVQSGAVDYGVPNTITGLSSLYDQIQFAPSVIASSLMLLGLVLPVAGTASPQDSVRFRCGAQWRKWFIILILLVVLALALLGNAAVP